MSTGRDDEVQRPRAKAVDVAALAQVSIATVSLVANDKAEGRVSESTRQRVLQAIEQLGYVVNSAARSLATGRRQCVALVARDMTNPFISTIAAGVSEALGTQTQLLLAVTGAGNQTPDVERVVNFGVDGVLLDFPIPGVTESAGLPCPVVLLDDPKPPRGVSSVRFDLQHGAGELADHLTRLRHRMIVYLDTPRQFATFKDRRRYVSDQLRRQGRDVQVIRTSSDIEIAAARSVIRRGWPEWHRAGATAIVAASDVQAYGALAALTDLGVGVPDDVSLASFDDLPFSSITSPPLTAISLPAFDLGFEAATLLQDIIERGERARRTVQLPTQLIARQSTGPARTGRRRPANRSG